MAKVDADVGATHALGQCVDENLIKQVAEPRLAVTCLCYETLYCSFGQQEMPVVCGAHTSGGL